MTRSRTRGPVLACGVRLTLAACPSVSVAMPSNDATAEQVVASYADAVHAGDCHTADSLVHRDGLRWCGTIDITSLKVTHSTHEKGIAGRVTDR